MNFEVSDVIDKKFKVIGVCSDSGGMGKVLIVEDINSAEQEKLALKYCREEDEEYIKRFKREVRLIEQFSGNPKIVKTVYSNTDHEPPYFVMDYYPDGDLTSIIDSLEHDIEKQETIFNQMIDCISELHSINVFHRDIKPQNFLISGENIVVSDFGLGMEPNSSSRFTSSSMFWGTQGYLPPEFQNGGFKHADQTGDIFMLGKSFYVLLTKQNPTYLMDNGLHPALFHVVERACELDKNRRYQTLAEMKQALQMAYDVIIGRGGLLGEVSQLISTINDRLKNENKYTSATVIEFIEKLKLVDEADQIRICLELKKPFISILTQEKLAPYLDGFLKIYAKMVSSEQYGWSFAETIALNMERIFKDDSIPNKTRAIALELAIDAAYRMNRFAAMETCISMITSVTKEDLGLHVANVMQKNPHDFVKDIEPFRCKCESIRKLLIAIKN